MEGEKQKDREGKEKVELRKKGKKKKSKKQTQKASHNFIYIIHNLKILTSLIILKSQINTTMMYPVLTHTSKIKARM